MYDYLIVGAGFSGAVLAERLASQAGMRVLIVDRRHHVGGNAYDCYNEDGVLIHPYGPHIFHTNSERIFHYLSLFTEWRPYEHRVLSAVDGQFVPMPINRTTVNMLFDLCLTTDQECADFFARHAAPMGRCRTSEDVVVSQVGAELYRKLFQGYTKKQWGVDASQLDAQVTARVPARTSTDDRYFLDQFQFMPKRGYTWMFDNMLSHDRITVALRTDYRDVGKSAYRKLIFTGPIDEYFDHCFGRLPYRSLEFRHETVATNFELPGSVVNYPNENEYTRVTEFKRITGQRHAKTSIVYEFPKPSGDPFYPIPRRENRDLYEQYQALAASLPDVHFVGRLATYQYYNMDQVVGQALRMFDKLHPGAGREERFAMA